MGSSMGNDWFVYVYMFGITAIVLMRLDRLGKQIEAVCAEIRADVARTEEDRQEILDDWKQSRKDAAKDARQFWIFWGVIGVAALIWIAVKHG
ncbi:hypothetical protein SAMN05444159_4372 [Bradyrhizobium lablabi]|uniref:Uncharacterized protein n=1 Tax=Bradyrhizobium lablabi TaxID=722472 RepID=A0A1M6VWA2_9BRAD|nr:hypothetical protein [Bradyrhizobium lablabi]SHK85709.1 hypothetical protein SAMN05444159_4372 [Bradyrhizobium lablabi]